MSHVESKRIRQSNSTMSIESMRNSRPTHSLHNKAECTLFLSLWSPAITKIFVEKRLNVPGLWADTAREKPGDEAVQQTYLQDRVKKTWNDHLGKGLFLIVFGKLVYIVVCGFKLLRSAFRFQTPTVSDFILSYSILWTQPLNVSKGFVQFSVSGGILCTSTLNVIKARSNTFSALFVSHPFQNKLYPTSFKISRIFLVTIWQEQI